MAGEYPGVHSPSRCRGGTNNVSAAASDRFVYLCYSKVFCPVGFMVDSTPGMIMPGVFPSPISGSVDDVAIAPPVSLLLALF